MAARTDMNNGARARLPCSVPINTVLSVGIRILFVSVSASLNSVPRLAILLRSVICFI
jgi:hypothetical protein